MASKRMAKKSMGSKRRHKGLRKLKKGRGLEIKALKSLRKV